MFDFDQFKQYLEVDKLNLDDELVNHAVLLGEVSDAYAEALCERDDLKEVLAQVDADISSEIREKLESNGKKATEAIVAADTLLSPQHQKAYKAYAEARSQAARLGALKEAFLARGYMIRDLCSLYVSNYFENSSVKSTGNTDRAEYEFRRQKLARKHDR